MDLNVLIVGGGVHGVGLLHDLASRGCPGVHLVEKEYLASGTSSRSTKLIHGGLRYLEHLNQWPLVHEALKERTLFLRLLPELVKPLPLILPSFKGVGRPPWVLGLGLFFYDRMARTTSLPKSIRLKNEEILPLAPYFNKDLIANQTRGGFLYYDAQMVDDAIVRVAAAAAVKLGASYAEQTDATFIEPIAGGFRVKLTSAEGTRTVSAKYVVNAAGIWCNANLARWGFFPEISCLLNLGSHLVFAPQATGVNQASGAGAVIQKPDGRIIFFIPWCGQWLLGTTESLFQGKPGGLVCPDADKSYLLESAKTFFNLGDIETHLKSSFCGVRCIPLQGKISKKTQLGNQKVVGDPSLSPFHGPGYLTQTAQNISAISRETVIHEGPKGLFSIYGGKYTTYRSVAQKIGNTIALHLGHPRPSQTHVRDAWFLDALKEEQPEIFMPQEALWKI